MIMRVHWFALLLVSLSFISRCTAQFSGDLSSSASERHAIDGKLVIDSKVRDIVGASWPDDVRIFIDGGNYLGFLKEDGSFRVTNLPSGSYVIEVAHPSLVFEKARVDISSKGKFRARRVNNLKFTKVESLPYPLKLNARHTARYFLQREEFRVTDFLYQPMFLMMVLPMVLMFILPKMMSMQDQELQQEMNQQMNMLTNPRQNMPDLSEWVTKAFGGSGSGGSSGQGGSKKSSKTKLTRRR